MVFFCFARLRTGLLRVVLRVDMDFDRGGAMSAYKLSGERRFDEVVPWGIEWVDK